MRTVFENGGFLFKIFSKKVIVLRNRIDESRVVESFHPRNGISPLLMTFFSFRWLLIPYIFEDVHEVDNSVVICYASFREFVPPRHQPVPDDIDPAYGKYRTRTCNNFPKEKSTFL